MTIFAEFDKLGREWERCHVCGRYVLRGMDGRLRRHRFEGKHCDGSWTRGKPEERTASG